MHVRREGEDGNGLRERLKEAVVTKHLMPAWLWTTMMAFLVGYAIGPARSAALQQAPAAGAAQAPLAGALPPGGLLEDATIA